MAEILADTDWSEHYIKRGDPKKPTYYIIRRQYETTGLLGRYNIFAGHIRYALSNGWLPVIDMQNYPNSYLAPEKLGKENSWEYYFEQPLRIGLEQAYSGENIILCMENRGFVPYSSNSFYDPHNIIMAEWRMLVKLGLLKVKSVLMEEILAIREKLFAPNDRVLGVLLRGTDYISLKPKGHPIPPPTEFARNVIIEKIRAWKCNKIFLATEDKNIIQYFKETFGDGFGDFFLILDREYVDYVPGKLINSINIDRENDYYLQGKEYLTQLVILSKCTSFIMTKCSGAGGVMLLADNFENVYAFNLGTYGIKPVDWRKLIGR